MNFDKNQIQFDGTSKEIYVVYGPERKFIARFKYRSPKRSANKFVQFLTKNFSVDEYFSKREAGQSPLRILEEKGFVCYNQAQLLKNR